MGMNTGERIKQARLAAGLTQTELADKIGVKFSAVHKYESGKVVNLKRETLAAIARTLNVSESWLLCLEQEEGRAPARDIDLIYDALNDSGQKELCRYGRYLTGLADFQAEDAQPQITYIRHYLVPAAAGYASPIEGEEYEEIPLPADAPADADFCIDIQGDSMEPYIRNGQRVYVKRGAPLKEFEPGFFRVAFFDIRMDDMTGIQLAEQVRKQDTSLLICFLTTSREYAFDAFPIHPFDYLIKPVDQEKLNHVMDEVVRSLAVIKDPEVREKLAKINAGVLGMEIDPFYGAPELLVVLANKEIPTYVYDGSLVMGNLMNAAADLGVSSCWVHRAKEEFESEEGKAILKALGVEGDYEGIGNLILGYAAKPAAAAAPRKANYIYSI